MNSVLIALQTNNTRSCAWLCTTVSSDDNAMTKSAYTNKISVSPFAMRQIGVDHSSKYGGFTGTAEQLVDMLDGCDMLPGNREYVRIIHLDRPSGFLTTFAEVDEETPIYIKMERRREGEAAVPVAYCTAQRKPASSVDVVLYSKEQLEKDGSEVSDGEWQVVAINCRVKDCEVEPQNPYSMLRNWFSKNRYDSRGIGGSPYTDKDPNEFIEELYDALMYWCNVAKTTDTAPVIPEKHPDLCHEVRRLDEDIRGLHDALRSTNAAYDSIKSCVNSLDRAVKFQEAQIGNLRRRLRQ